MYVPRHVHFYCHMLHCEEKENLQDGAFSAQRYDGVPALMLLTSP